MFPLWLLRLQRVTFPTLCNPKGQIRLGWGHALNKYNDIMISKEAFAEITSATVANEESLKTLKKFLPKTVEEYNNMIENYIGVSK